MKTGTKRKNAKNLTDFVMFTIRTPNQDLSVIIISELVERVGKKCLLRQRRFGF